MKENGKISFLDVLIIRNNNTLKTTVYRKKTHNRVYVGNLSCHCLGNAAHCSQ